jgi:hypothetical protein
MPEPLLEFMENIIFWLILKLTHVCTHVIIAHSLVTRVTSLSRLRTIGTPCLLRYAEKLLRCRLFLRLTSTFGKVCAAYCGMFDSLIPICLLQPDFLFPATNSSLSIHFSTRANSRRFGVTRKSEKCTERHIRIASIVDSCIHYFN